MNPAASLAVLPVGDSLTEAHRNLSRIEAMLDVIVGDLTGENASLDAESEHHGSLQYSAGRIARRAAAVADRLEYVRGVLTSPRVEELITRDMRAKTSTQHVGGQIGGASFDRVQRRLDGNYE